MTGMHSSPQWQRIFNLIRPSGWKGLSLTIGPWILVSGPLLSGHAPESEAAEIDERIEEVYLTLEEALRVVLPESNEVVPEVVQMTPVQQQRIEAESGRPMAESPVTVYVGKTDGRIDGYALVTEEIGMYKPITSMVGVTPDGRVKEVAVMVYRESRGGEIRRKRFLSQYRGSRRTDPIRLNKDIINVTGATLSVRSMNAQVRKALAIVHEWYLRKAS